MPLGGYKQSGFGREGNMEVMNHYTVLKAVVINLDAPSVSDAVSVRPLTPITEPRVYP